MYFRICFKKIALTILITLTTFIHTSFSETRTERLSRFFSEFEILPEYHFETDLRWFFNHQNDFYREKFLVESHTRFDAMFVSWREKVFLGGYYINNVGMGRQYEDIVFDPRDVGYALSPFIETRLDDFTLRFGLDHRCHHQIDRKTRPSIYWNQLFISVGSKQNPMTFYGYNHHNEFSSHLDRLSWEVYLGYYVTDLGEMVRPAILSGGHNLKTGSYVAARYAFHSNEDWLFTAGHKTHLDTDHDGKYFWSGRFDIEASVHKFRNSIAFYLDYHYEFPRQRPFYSKDRLITFGTRFFF
ncbi:hypothetical protein CHISP_2890 [Chitinispirillum alkaliphilum]|nr:hypothetical protein CHISP_2890 [Chitinispirillum alkaliphilum]